MQKKRFREEEIIKILKEGESCVNIDELTRRYNISRRTYYNWRK